MIKVKTFSVLILATLMILASCESESKNENNTYNEGIASDDLAEMELKFDKEKIYLLSVTREMSYDTVYQILKDYYKMEYGNLLSGDIGLTDESIAKYEENIAEISKKYKLSKPKVASLIFSFKYEMRTADEIIEDYQSSEMEVYEHQ